MDNQTKEYLAIQRHGKEKARLTILINGLKQTYLKNDKIILAAIDLLEKERQRLNKSGPLTKNQPFDIKAFNKSYKYFRRSKYPFKRHKKGG